MTILFFPNCGRLMMALCLALTSSTCTTTSNLKRPEGRIVERSKQSRPVWADAPANQLVVNATEAKMHYVSLKERDLPIAIKSAQTDAINASYPIWRPSFEARLAEFPKLIGAKTVQNAVEFSNLLEQAAHKVHTQAAQIEDIYYERILIENPEKVPELVGVPEYFDVHVLVQLLPVDSAKIQTALHQVFSAAKAPELKRAGKDLALNLKIPTAPRTKK